MPRPDLLPEPTPAQRKTEIERYIAEYAAAHAAASPAERELEGFGAQDPSERR